MSQEYGPQYKGDNQFTARMRFHQSWYRANILKLPFGVGPKKNGNKRGSMLRPVEGEKGRNFLSPEIFSLAKARVAQKTGAVEEYRLYHNMLSSMPMCFNLFGPLKLDLDLASKLMSSMIPNEVKEVSDILFEFSPTPRKEYLNDRSAFDVFVEFRTYEDELAFIGIEVKLTEPFSQAKHQNPRYDFWTQQDGTPWLEEFWGLLVEKDVNQLWRNHLLVQALASVQEDRYTKGFFMTIYHHYDKECTDSLEKYFTYLKPGHNPSHFSLEEIQNLWKPLVENTKYKKWFDDFSLRYLDLTASDSAYKEFISS